MSKLKKFQTGCVPRQWLESVYRSGLQCEAFIFIPGQAGVKGNERASRDTLVDSRVMDQTYILDAIRYTG